MMRYTQQRYSSDDQGNTVDRMVSSLPRPSNPGPPPHPITYNPVSEIDAAPMPAVPSGPRPLFVAPEKPNLLSRFWSKSNVFGRRKSKTRPTSPEASVLSLPPLPQNEAISLELYNKESGHRRTFSGDPEFQKARLVYEGDESVCPRAGAAAWLGGPGEDRTRIRSKYLRLYNLRNMSILQALRALCNRLYLQGESQQLERILLAFSERWYECNERNGFFSVDVVNLVAYSLVILNGDLHRPEVENKMTRAQYVRNTALPLADIAIEKVPDAFIDNDSPEASPLRQHFRRRSQSPTKSPITSEFRNKRSFECSRPSQRLVTRPSEPIVSTLSSPALPDDNDCGPLVNSPFFGKRTLWEKQIENMLKKFYTSLKELPLPILPNEHQPEMPRPSRRSSRALLVPGSSILKRSPSMASRSDSQRPSVTRQNLHPQQAKQLARPKVPNLSIKATSARSSLDAQSSPPSPSSLWSKVSNPFGKTQTTMSTYSLASSATRPEYQQAIGFANALSHAIIKEDEETDDDKGPRKGQCLDDESLELEGAPWAKEGIVKHKHVYEAVGKRAKARQWIESFAVIERGHLRLFSFTKNANRSWKRRSSEMAGGTVVGGGNWLDAAELLGSFELIHVLATALPQNEYSRSRPHVWALSLPTGALHLFSVGTPEIAKEFTDTANYWSARMSKKPFRPGLTNANYGFDILPNLPLPPHSRHGSTNSAHLRRGSSSHSHSSNLTFTPNAPAPSLSSAVIIPWKSPPPSLSASQLLEVDQLAALSDYRAELDLELQKHGALRAPLRQQWRHPDPRGAQALANWDLKNRYLTAERAKVGKFVDALEGAGRSRTAVYAERGRRERELEALK